MLQHFLPLFTFNLLLTPAAAGTLSCEDALALIGRLGHELQAHGLVQSACADVPREIEDPLPTAPDAIRTKQNVCLEHAANLEGASTRLRIALLQNPPTGCPTLGALLNRPHVARRLSDMHLTSGYGVRVHPILRRKRLHTGLDLDAQLGDPVGSHAAGEVVQAGRRGGYGLAVEVAHASGYTTLYAHLSRIDVRPGDIVLTGHQLGLAGSTGLSTGPHLHWEVRSRGQPINPSNFLDHPNRLQTREPK